ncbi:hypothetical protein L218DRAFT_1036980, partial [Marasmius fiardii PR-910]
MKYEQLEGLPGAVSRESLRLSCGMSATAPRPVGEREVTIAGCRMPPGLQILVGCASYTIPSNPTVIPEPHSFIPELWLGENLSWKIMSQHLRKARGLVWE